MTPLAELVAAWGGLRLVDRIAEGNRNEVWQGELDGTLVSVRRSRRSTASLDWELDLIGDLHEGGLRVPTVVETIDERRHHDGVVVQHWLAGRPPESEADWRSVANALQRVHATASDRTQRPGCCVVTELGLDSVSVDADVGAVPDAVATELLAIFASFTDAPVSTIHGDAGASNFRIDDSGAVGLLDFDESRIDLCWHDLSELGVQVLDDAAHHRSQLLSCAWEAVNAWVVEPEYARTRLDQLRRLHADPASGTIEP